MNEGKNFVTLRQVYQSMILAAWYKKTLKDSILNKVYSSQKKINGVNTDDPQIKEKIYQQYLDAFKKGVYNYIKEDYDSQTEQIVPHKYFSGGINITDFSMLALQTTDTISDQDKAQLAKNDHLERIVGNYVSPDEAMLGADDFMAKIYEKYLPGNAPFRVEEELPDDPMRINKKEGTINMGFALPYGLSWNKREPLGIGKKLEQVKVVLERETDGKLYISFIGLRNGKDILGSKRWRIEPSGLVEVEDKIVDTITHSLRHFYAENSRRDGPFLVRMTIPDNYAAMDLSRNVVLGNFPLPDGRILGEEQSLGGGRTADRWDLMHERDEEGVEFIRFIGVKRGESKFASKRIKIGDQPTTWDIRQFYEKHLSRPGPFIADMEIPRSYTRLERKIGYINSGFPVMGKLKTFKTREYLGLGRDVERVWLVVEREEDGKIYISFVGEKNGKRILNDKRWRVEDDRLVEVEDKITTSIRQFYAEYETRSGPFRAEMAMPAQYRRIDIGREFVSINFPLPRGQAWKRSGRIGDPDADYWKVVYERDANGREYISFVGVGDGEDISTTSKIELGDNITKDFRAFYREKAQTNGSFRAQKMIPPGYLRFNSKTKTVESDFPLPGGRKLGKTLHLDAPEDIDAWKIFYERQEEGAENIMFVGRKDKTDVFVSQKIPVPDIEEAKKRLAESLRKRFRNILQNNPDYNSVFSEFDHVIERVFARHGDHYKEARSSLYHIFDKILDQKINPSHPKETAAVLTRFLRKKYRNFLTQDSQLTNDLHAQSLTPTQPVEFKSRRGDKTVTLPPEITAELVKMTQLARKNDVELLATLYFKEGEIVGMDYPQDETKFVVIKSKSTNEFAVTEQTDYYLAPISRLYALKNRLEKIKQAEDQKDEEVLRNLRQEAKEILIALGKDIRQHNAEVEVYSAAQGRRYPIDAQRLIELKDLQEVPELLADLSRVETAVSAWFGSYPLVRHENIPEHDEIMTVHSHPNENPTPPSAIVADGHKFGDIYTHGFFAGEVMGIIMDTPPGDRLFLFHEPDASREEKYVEAYNWYWYAEGNPAAGSAALWDENARTYGPSPHRDQVLRMIEGLAMSTPAPLFLTTKTLSPTTEQDQAQLSSVSNPARYGGIDMNPDKLNLQTPGEGVKFDIPVENRNLEKIPVNGLTPVIFEITPVKNLPVLLGFGSEKEGQLSLAP